jgi:hypothetical protein
MEFENQVQKEVCERVCAWMRDLFGPRAAPRDDGLGCRALFGSAAVDVSVCPWGENEAVILARASVVSGATMNAELLRYLLDKNCEVRFGAFGVDKNGDIVFQHAIVGSTCQKEELKASVQQVMLVADLCDEQIVAMWGGRRAIDREPR